jgi:hypothetical protein
MCQGQRLRIIKFDQRFSSMGSLNLVSIFLESLLVGQEPMKIEFSGK